MIIRKWSETLGFKKTPQTSMGFILDPTTIMGFLEDLQKNTIFFKGSPTLQNGIKLGSHNQNVTSKKETPPIIHSCNVYLAFFFNKFPMWEKSWLIYHISVLCNLRQLFMVLFDQIHMDSCPWVPAKKREYNTPFSPPSILIWGLGPHFILQIYLYKVTDYPSKGLDSLHKKLNIFSST